VASQLIEEVTAHAQSDSLEDAWEICADGTYFPNNLRSSTSSSSSRNCSTGSIVVTTLLLVVAAAVVVVVVVVVVVEFLLEAQHMM